jgi:predicted nucleotidyltransferase
VHEAVSAWAQEVAASRPEVLRVGYFGSYAKGNWGVGSDVDLVVVVNHSGRPFHQRSMDFETGTLPVPADVVVYTPAELQALAGMRFGRVLETETVWVYERR